MLLHMEQHKVRVFLLKLVFWVEFCFIFSYSLIYFLRQGIMGEGVFNIFLFFLVF